MTAFRIRDESGFTLVELLITMLVLAVVLSIVSAGFLSTSRAVGTADRGIRDLGDARIGIDAATRLLRNAVRQPSATVAPSFCVAATREIMFFANANGGTRRVRYYVNSQSEFVEEVTTAPDCAPAAASPRVLARNMSSGAVFSFYARGSQVAMTVPTAGLDVAERSDIAAVGVQVAVEGTGGPALATELVGRVRLPNLVQMGSL